MVRSHHPAKLSLTVAPFPTRFHLSDHPNRPYAGPKAATPGEGQATMGLGSSLLVGVEMGMLSLGWIAYTAGDLDRGHLLYGHALEVPCRRTGI